MCGWECSGCSRGYCREIRGARSALLRCVLEGCLVRWSISISTVYLSGSHVHCLLLPLLLFFSFFWNTQFTVERSAEKEGQPIIQIRDPHPKSWVSGSAGRLAYRRSAEG